jgi:hypothetical protein
MRASLSRRRRLIFTGVALLAMAAVGLVYAAWTTNGSGSGYAKAGSSQALTTIDGAASTTATLYPGVNGNVRLEIDNPNPYPVRVTAVSGNGTITADAAHVTAGCTNANTGVTFTNQTGLTIDVAADASATTTLNNAVSMSNASDNGCQGATFTIPVSLTGASNAS